MPLRAIIDEKEIISTFLSENEWENLKDRVSSESLDVIIYQTNKKGYLRKSKNGLQHFAHKKGELPENWKPESPQHLFIKNEILLGCKDAGWNAFPEFKENNWESDVLAIKGKHRIAFEVQWSPQSYEKTSERQNRYKNDNVRCCWFFKNPPKEIRNYFNDIIENKEIPIFKIFENENKNLMINFHSEEFEIRKFVKILLDGKIKFSNRMKSKSIQNISINIFETKCWKCGTIQHSYFLGESIKSKCGLDIFLENSMWDDGDNLKYNKQIIEAVNKFSKTKEGSHIKLGQIKKRYSKTIDAFYHSFGCYKCDAIFGDWYLHQEIMEIQMSSNFFELIINIELPEIVNKNEHWCYNEKKDFCCK